MIFAPADYDCPCCGAEITEGDATFYLAEWGHVCEGCAARDARLVDVDEDRGDGRC